MKMKTLEKQAGEWPNREKGADGNIKGLDRITIKRTGRKEEYNDSPKISDGVVISNIRQQELLSGRAPRS